MKLAGVVLAVLLSSTGMAEGSDWQIVAANADGTIWEIDQDSRASTSGMTESWVKAVYPQGSRDYDSQIAVWRVDCMRRAVQILEMHQYVGTQLQGSSREPLPWLRIMPDTAFEQVSAAICAH